MELRFKRKGKDLFTSIHDGKFYVASKDLNIIEGVTYLCSQLKKFRQNPKGRAKSGFVVTVAEPIVDSVLFDINLNTEIIYMFKNGRKGKEIQMITDKPHKKKKNWLGELEKGHKDKERCLKIFQKHFKVIPEDLALAYDSLRDCVNLIHKKKNSYPYFRKRVWQ